jgi:hypothetical protein
LGQSWQSIPHVLSKQASSALHQQELNVVKDWQSFDTKDKWIKLNAISAHAEETAVHQA